MAQDKGSSDLGLRLHFGSGTGVVPSLDGLGSGSFLFARKMRCGFGSCLGLVRG